MLFAFILQVGLISVNYKRDVLKDYITNNGLSDIEYIYSLKKEPHLVQVKQLAIILPKNLKKLINYQPNSPWKKETRRASSTVVINSSIEKNSINFWWVRIFHWKFSSIGRFVSVVILILGFLGAIMLFKYVKREII